MITRAIDATISGFYGPTWVTLLLYLALLVPSLSVQVRRLHDIGKSGKNLMWFIIAEIVWGILLFITGVSALVAIFSGTVADPTSFPMGFLLTLGVGGLVFLVWGIIFLVWLCSPGDKGENKYGPDPKALTE